MKYRSTRSNETVTALEALVKGLADDGGLYVPESLPAPFLHADELKDMSYEELAAFVLSHFLTDIPKEELRKLTHSAYTGTFETEEIVPVKPLSQAFPWRKCSMAEPAPSRIWPFLFSRTSLCMPKGREGWQGNPYPHCYLRRYGQSSVGRVPRCARRPYYGILSFPWRKPSPEGPDAETAGEQCEGRGH